MRGWEERESVCGDGGVGGFIVGVCSNWWWVGTSSHRTGKFNLFNLNRILDSSHVTYTLYIVCNGVYIF